MVLRAAARIDANDRVLRGGWLLRRSAENRIEKAVTQLHTSNEDFYTSYDTRMGENTP